MAASPFVNSSPAFPFSLIMWERCYYPGLVNSPDGLSSVILEHTGPEAAPDDFTWPAYIWHDDTLTDPGLEFTIEFYTSSNTYIAINDQGLVAGVEGDVGCAFVEGVGCLNDHHDLDFPSSIWYLPYHDNDMTRKARSDSRKCWPPPSR